MLIFEEHDKRFYVDKSTLPDAGYGLFANVPLKSGDWLEVMGVMVKKGSISDLCTHYARRYKFRGSKGDASIIPLGYAGIVNHSSDSEIRNCVLTNIPGLSKRSEHSSEVVYQFTRDIMIGEEIIGDYGAVAGGEAEKIAENYSVVKENSKDWGEFLSYNLYDLPRLCNLL